MKKKLIVLAFCLLLAAIPLFATENNSKTHVSYGSGIFLSRIGVERDLGQWEIGGGIDSGFPNLFIGALVSDTDDNPLDLLVDSLTILYGGTIFATFDCLPSPRHDLDLGFSIQPSYTNLFGNGLFVVLLNAKLRYAYNFSNGIRIFAEMNIPTANYSKNFANDDKGSFGFSLLQEGTLTSAIIFGSKLGLSFSF